MPYHDKGSKDGGKEDQQQTQGQQTQGPQTQEQQTQEQQPQEQQTQEEQTQEQPLNPIVEVNLNALPGEMMFQITGEQYVGKFHIHKDGTIMAGLGELGADHEIIPERVIVRQPFVEEQVEGYYDFDLGEEFPALTVASPNEFTEFITTKEYNWLVERVVNVSTFLSTFSNMMNSFNGYIAGGYLRRVIQSGDAFQFQNADLDFWFPTSDDLFGAVNFVNQGNLTQFNQPDVQEISVGKVLYSWDLISNTNNFPNIKLQLISRLVGDISNIISSFDFTNAKIATNLNQVVVDSRWETLESNKFVNIDTVQSVIINRLLKYLHSEGEPFILNGSSALKFLSWVGSIVEFPETNNVTLTHMQVLYDVLLNTSQVDYETISFMKPLLSELSFPPLQDLTKPNLPLNVS